MSQSTSGEPEVVDVEPTDTTETPLVATRGGLSVLKTPEDMRAAMERSAAQLRVAHEFVDSQFVKEIDWGPTDPRSDKPTLKKPGAEKLCKLFGTHAQWRMDADTWKMLGEPAGKVCYICEIVSDASGEIVGTGRGVGEEGQQGRDANKAVKIAEKRALVDAALYTFGLSERFTQDEGGGGGRTTLAEGRDLLTQKLSEARAGLDSELADHDFLKLILKSELHKGHVATVGELGHINKVLFEEELYDLGTGKKKRKAKKKAKPKAEPKAEPRAADTEDQGRVDAKTLASFRRRVAAKRKGDSTLSDDAFVVRILDAEFGGMLALTDLNREQFEALCTVLKMGKYDWVTGEAIPDGVGKE